MNGNQWVTYHASKDIDNIIINYMDDKYSMLSTVAVDNGDTTRRRFYLSSERVRIAVELDIVQLIKEFCMVPRNDVDQTLVINGFFDPFFVCDLPKPGIRK